MDDEVSKDGEDGGGGHGGEDEFVFGRLLHAPIITYPGGDARVNLENFLACRKACGERRVYGSHTRAPPAYMEHHV